MAKKKKVADAEEQEKVAESPLTYVEIKRFLALLKAHAEYPERELKFDLPEGFRETFESQQAFRGWLAYHVTWDVTRADPWTARLREISLAAEWARELMRVCPVIAADGTIMEAGEWEQKQRLTQ